MQPLKLLLAIIWICLSLPFSAEADSITVPIPLNSPVFIDLEVYPVVTVGPRTIDFTPNLSQQFIEFFFLQTPDFEYGAWRETMAVRARDGLATLTSNVGPSPDPRFVNTIPSFPIGTRDLILFDLIVPGGSSFALPATDLNGGSSPGRFATPVPEPTTAILGLTAVLIGTGSVLWRRSRYSQYGAFGRKPGT